MAEPFDFPAEPKCAYDVRTPAEGEVVFAI